MQAYYRNKETGEIKLVEQDSAEMFELQQEVGQDGHSRWEQTSFAHASDVLDKAKHGELEETDLGKDHQAALRHAAVALDASGVAPERNPHLALTPGEIEQGLTPSQKLDDLRSMYDEDALSERGGILEDAADTIADEREDAPSRQPTRGQSARAGGSDEREGAPRAKAPAEGDEGEGGAQSGASVPSGPAGRTATAPPAVGSGQPGQPREGGPGEGA